MELICIASKMHWFFKNPAKTTKLQTLLSNPAMCGLQHHEQNSYVVEKLQIIQHNYVTTINLNYVAKNNPLNLQ